MLCWYHFAFWQNSIVWVWKQLNMKLRYFCAYPSHFGTKTCAHSQFFDKGDNCTNSVLICSKYTQFHVRLPGKVFVWIWDNRLKCFVFINLLNRTVNQFFVLETREVLEIWIQERINEYLKKIIKKCFW